MHNPESVLENMMHIILWDINLSSRPSDSQQKKENLLNSGLWNSCWPQGKAEGKWKER